MAGAAGGRLGDCADVAGLAVGVCAVGRTDAMREASMIWWFIGGIVGLVLFAGAFLWFIREAMRASE